MPKSHTPYPPEFREQMVAFQSRKRQQRDAFVRLCPDPPGLFERAFAEPARLVFVTFDPMNLADQLKQSAERLVSDRSC